MYLSLRLSLVAAATALLCACGNGMQTDGGDARTDSSVDGSMTDGSSDALDRIGSDSIDAPTDRGGEIASDVISDGAGDDGSVADGGDAGPCTDLDLDGYGDGPGCLGPDCNDHDANAHPGALEICNNDDDDCNGMVDDGLGSTSCGVGVCRRTVDNCIAGVVQPCTPGMPTTETCNGIDDDCNGVVDEGIADITCGTGACRVTVPGCTAGTVPTCTPGTAGTETCNGTDDDCDGTIDNGFGAVTCGTGACERTVSSCSGGTMGMCTPGTAGTESCNNIDDDCNGTVDDGLGMTTCGIGACQRTVQNCVSGRANACTPGTPASEVCNGIDDNCNGVVDEGFGTMSCGMGACARTVDLCSGGMLQSCVAGTPVPETCNGIDDNCNGTADEGLGATTCGRGVCVRTVSNCIGGSPQMCVPGTPGTETCNGLDDDCDGMVDDGLGSSTCGTGACIRTVPNCVAGVPQTCMPTPMMPETCNAIDDDCDGMIDEMLTQSCYTGPAGTSGVGTCRAGTATCSSGVYGTCAGQTLPATESCNNMDDNCNGMIDDGVTRTCYTGASGTQGVGVCRGGTQTCTAGVFATACAGQVIPSTEICNNMDDDCNGAIDNGVTQSCYAGPAGTAGVGICRAGTQTCTTGTFGTCTGSVLPATETCNNMDDNCNGSIDDGVTRTCYTGASGTQGVGVCRGGTQACTAGVFATACSGQVVPSTEICNNMDDDCNGAIDNGVTQSCYTGPAGTSGIGICRAGTQTCTTGTFGSCTGQVLPATETCNNMDDDCDNMIDDGVTRTCYTGPAGTQGMGVCRGGTQACTAGVFATTCSGQVVPSTELCNNVDDDCDGSVDETITQSCYSGPSGTAGVGACRAGSQTCSAGTFSACSGQVLPIAEVCNAIDDNCNGSVDDGLALATCGVGACARTGTTCAASSCTAGTPGTETCNNIDDNCNGSIDDGVSQTCYTGPAGTNGVGLCHGGTQTCSAGAFGACTGQVVPVAEVCGNGLDDNCDGSVDNGCGPANDTRAGATVIDLANPAVTLSADTTAATNNTTTPSCICTSGNDVFYRFTLTATEVVYADTFGTAWDTSLFFQDSAGANVAPDAMFPGSVVCNDDMPVSCDGTTGRQSQVVTRLAAGTYYLVLSGCSSGAATIHFQHFPLGNGPIAVLAAGTNVNVSGTTSGTGLVTGVCSSGGAENTYYWVTCPTYAGGAFSATTCGLTTWDTSIDQRSAGRTPVSVCQDDDSSCASSIRASTIASTIPAGAGLHVFYLDAFSSSYSGAYTFRYTRP